LKRVATLSERRNIIAHHMFGPTDEGDGIFILRVRAKGKFSLPEERWSDEDCDQLAAEMFALRAALEEIEHGLREHIDLTALLESMANEGSPQEGPQLAAYPRPQSVPRAPSTKRRLGGQIGVDPLASVAVPKAAKKRRTKKKD
jgi:hypothetical protein